MKRTFRTRMDKRDQLLNDALDAIADFEDAQDMDEDQDRISDNLVDQAEALATADARALQAAEAVAPSGALGENEELNLLRVQMTSLKVRGVACRGRETGAEW